MKTLIALLALSVCAFAQNPASFAGWYNAYNYAYGVNRGPSSLRVDKGNTVTGSQSTITLAFGISTLVDGRYFTPLATNAPITLGSGTTTETVTPSAVNCTTPQLLDTCTVTATFTQIHSAGDQVRSGTIGLQEALNAAAAAGGGAGVVDSVWYANGGTSGILAAAIVTGVTATCDNSKGAGCGSGTGGAVTSVFTRTGAVTAQAGDYASFYLSNTQAFTSGAFLYSFGPGGFLIPTSASDPATCTAGQIYFNTGSTLTRSCTATNTWTTLAGGGGVSGATLNGVTVPIAGGILGFQLPNIANTGLGVNNVLSGTGNSQVNTLEVNLNPDTSLTNGATIPATDCGGALLSSSTQTWNLPQANLGGNFVTGRTLTFINTGGTLTITPSTSSIGPGAGGASYAISPGTTAAPHTVTLMSQGGNYAIVYDSLQPERAIGTIFGDGTAVLSSGLTNYYVVPFACAKGIDGWNMTVTPSGGTAAVDVWKIATGTAVPTVANTITGSVVPTLSTGTVISSTTLTGWTKTVAAKDIFGFHVNSVAGSATQISITLGCQ